MDSLKESFHQYVLGQRVEYQEQDAAVTGLREVHDPMPDYICEHLGMPAGTSYAVGAALLDCVMVVGREYSCDCFLNKLWFPAVISRLSYETIFSDLHCQQCGAILTLIVQPVTHEQAADFLRWVRERLN